MSRSGSRVFLFLALSVVFSIKNYELAVFRLTTVHGVGKLNTDIYLKYLFMFETELNRNDKENNASAP